MVFFLAVWTARLAITKGRNGWIWGAAALILGLLPWHLIGVIPVLALMFIKAPVDSPGVHTNSLACGRCNKSHSESQHFCTGCGWDLNETYSSKELGADLSSSNQPHVSDPINVDENRRRPANEDTESDTANSELISEHEPISEERSLSEPNSEDVSTSPEPEHIPWGTYDVGEAPTAAVMVSRGIERFNEGKFQEAIDQFTKAIVLDPNYAEAWEHRSEAYAQLGRPQQAEDDRRHLNGLDPSSSPG